MLSCDRNHTAEVAMSDQGKEPLEVVDRSGSVVGIAIRAALHGNPSLIHRVVHVLLFNQKGQLLLQKRAQTKDIAPGKWDTSVGGHVHPGESIYDAAHREMVEELGIAKCDLSFLYEHLYNDQFESELVSTFTGNYSGTINFNTEEIDDIRYWDLQKITQKLGTSVFTEHFEKEIAVYLNNVKSSGLPFI